MHTTHTTTGALAVAVSLALAGCDITESTSADAALAGGEIQAAQQPNRPAHGKIVVANRGSASLSIIDTKTDEVTTVPMPDGGEPMYVVHARARNRVLVGDRANGRVVAFDARTLEVEGFVPAGDGVFHMGADPMSRQLWVVDNIGKALTVIDPKRLDVVTTVPVVGGTPHDVVVGPNGRYAYATVFVADGADQVVRYSTTTFQEVDRADTGEDPHLSVHKQNGTLYLPAQGESTVFVLDLETLDEVGAPVVPNAHGAAVGSNGRVFYTTNIAGGGVDGVVALDTRTNEVVGSASTAFVTPHNLAITADGRKLYVTHSGGTADKVSICTMTTRDLVPSCDAHVTVGLNPFGLAFVH